MVDRCPWCGTDPLYVHYHDTEWGVPEYDARALWENPENAQRIEKGTPMRRIGDPVDIAGAAIFLASDAGKYMAGQMIVVDGGSVIV